MAEGANAHAQRSHCIPIIYIVVKRSASQPLAVITSLTKPSHSLTVGAYVDLAMARLHLVVMAAAIAMCALAAQPASAGLIEGPGTYYGFDLPGGHCRRLAAKHRRSPYYYRY
jgi:hypothetical protein